MIEDVIITPLKIIETLGGDVYHVVKKDDKSFHGFGEAYFSSIKPGAVKAWKRHSIMTLNLTVPVGSIKFVVFDNRKNKNGAFQEVFLSQKNYCRLTIPPMLWVGFQGLDSKDSMLLNIASIPHDPMEYDKKEIEEINFNWKVNK